MVILMTLQALLLLALQLWIVTYSLFISSTRASPESCTCLPEYECMDPHGPYGSHPLDVAVLGLHAPCPVYGQVRCCDKSVVKWYYQDDRTEYVHGNANVDENSVPGLFNDSDDDSDSDTDQSKRKKSNMSMEVVKNPGKSRDFHFLTTRYYRAVY